MFIFIDYLSLKNLYARMHIDKIWIV
jgi:hypothetical protein